MKTVLDWILSRAESDMVKSLLKTTPSCLATFDCSFSAFSFSAFPHAVKGSLQVALLVVTDPKGGAHPDTKPSASIVQGRLRGQVGSRTEPQRCTERCYPLKWSPFISGCWVGRNWASDGSSQHHAHRQPLYPLSHHSPFQMVFHD